MHETSTDKSCVYRGAAAVTASVRDAKLMTRVPSLPILSCEGVSWPKMVGNAHAAVTNNTPTSSIRRPGFLLESPPHLLN